MTREKMLVLSPHQDDEINLAGGIIYGNKDKYDIYVAYLTEGNYCYSPKVRHKEAQAALAKLGVKKENIIYLGFDDCPYDADDHMYHSRNEEVTGAIYRLLDKMRADVIICSDLDFHPDHIMCSLCFERALGRLLKKEVGYNPRVFKAFAYENSYNGPDDFFEGKMPEFNTRKDGLLVSNPHYKIGDAKYFSNVDECNSYFLPNNPLWKAILCHKSQILVRRTKKIINSGYLLWERRTDNLLRFARIVASSGDASVLNDFMLCDSSNILGGNIAPVVFDKGYWFPARDDKKKLITIQLDGAVRDPILRVYPAANSDCGNEHTITIMSGDFRKRCAVQLPYIEVQIKGDARKIMVDTRGCDIRISEIELFEDKIQRHGNSQVLKMINKAPGRASRLAVFIGNAMILFHTIIQRIRRKTFFLTRRR